MNVYIPITGSKISNLYDYSSSSPTGCECEPCGCLKCFNWTKPHEVHSRSLLQDGADYKDSWLMIKIEILKNLVRKMYRNTKKSKAQFQYDAQSYALNFDDGVPEEEKDGLLCNFSSRFAVPVAVTVIAQKQSRDGL